MRARFLLHFEGVFTSIFQKRKPPNDLLSLIPGDALSWLLRSIGIVYLVSKDEYERRMAYSAICFVPIDLHGINPNGYASHPQGRGSRACS